PYSKVATPPCARRLDDGFDHYPNGDMALRVETTYCGDAGRKGTSPVMRLSRTQSWIRPWLAMAAAYALSLQLILSGLVGGHFDTALAADDGFAICHTDANGDGSNAPPVQHTPCMLCTLSQHFSAVCPTPQSVSLLHLDSLAVVFSEATDWTFQRRSPTGQYPRGPPTDMTVIG